MVFILFSVIVVVVKENALPLAHMYLKKFDWIYLTVWQIILTFYLFNVYSILILFFFFSPFLLLILFYFFFFNCSCRHKVFYNFFSFFFLLFSSLLNNRIERLQLKLEISYAAGRKNEKQTLKIEIVTNGKLQRKVKKVYLKTGMTLQNSLNYRPIFGLRIIKPYAKLLQTLQKSQENISKFPRIPKKKFFFFFCNTNVLNGLWTEKVTKTFFKQI